MPDRAHAGSRSTEPHAIDSHGLLDLMQNAPLDHDKIAEAAEWIADASDEAERNRRWDVVEALAGIWAVRVSTAIKALWADAERSA